MFADRLKLARKRAGLSMADLSARVSPTVSAQAISKYENGRMMPSSAVLVGLGRALDTSLDFLMGGQVRGLSGVEFRRHSGTTARDRARAEAMVIDRLEDYLAIEEILGLDAPPDPFEGVRAPAVRSLDEAERKAGDLRRHWKLGNDPIASMTRLLEDRGIRVILADFPEDFDGLACDVQRTGGRPESEVVVISSRTNVERKRFNLAHELAHRVIRGVSGPDLKLEKAMNRFAGAFLAPADHLRDEVGEGRHRITYGELVRLKRSYGLSACAMLYRLADTGLLPRHVMDTAFRTYARDWRRQEPEPIREEEGAGGIERPQRFERLVYRALGEDLISPVRAAQMLRCPLAVIDEQVRGPRTP